MNNIDSFRARKLAAITLMMASRIRQLALVAIVAGGILSLATAASAGSVEYLASGTPDSDGPGDAEALFTLSSGSLTLTLTDLEQNPTGPGQLVSGINFDIGGPDRIGKSNHRKLREYQLPLVWWELHCRGGKFSRIVGSQLFWRGSGLDHSQYGKTDQYYHRA